MTQNIITDPIKLRQRYDALMSTRKTVEQAWQEVERYGIRQLWWFQISAFPNYLLVGIL